MLHFFFFFNSIITILVQRTSMRKFLIEPHRCNIYQEISPTAHIENRCKCQKINSFQSRFTASTPFHAPSKTNKPQQRLKRTCQSSVLPGYVRRLFADPLAIVPLGAEAHAFAVHKVCPVGEYIILGRNQLYFMSDPLAKGL